MSSSGSGRGRGWLNLGKNNEPPRPGGLNQVISNEAPPIKSEYQDLIDRVKKISVNDDGIMFNKKMKYIQEFWSENCHGLEEVEKSFAELYNVCLNDIEIGSKLVMVMASRTFISKDIHDCNLRHQFLKHLQKDFDNSNHLQTTNPRLFRNCIHLIGEFYNKARLANGEPYKFLAGPFTSALDSLLNSKSLPDLILFTNQLFLNGTILKSAVPEELSNLGIKIRTNLSESQLSKEPKLWLLLALDLFNVRFGILPSDIYKYYESQLGAATMVKFQRPHDALSVETIHPSKILDSYQSNVNVLQISTSPTENDRPMSEFNGTQNSFAQEQAPRNKEKPGRPILGVGARFIKGKGEDGGSWGNKQNSSSGRSQNKKQPKSSNKGWEHDDRFENDY